jgi:tRNA modification GTPase
VAGLFEGPPLGGLRWGVVDGWIILGPGRVEVPARLVVTRAPRSYTGENVVEIHLPGTPILLDAVQDLLVGAGARLAEAGEFTRRAFLNGRIDLTRAEAVAALIRSRDGEERRRAVALLRGGLEQRLAVLRDRIWEFLIPLELSLDFSDQDLEIPRLEGLDAGLAAIRDELSALAAGQQARGSRREVYRVVLQGPANAGKSSLFNRLLGREAALVSGTAGTTRDLVTGEIRDDEMVLQLVDTAGVGVTRGSPDLMAHRHRRRILREADLVIEVRDIRQAARRPRPGTSRLRVYTHLDLAPDGVAPEEGALGVSNLSGAGIAELRRTLFRKLGSPDLEARSAPILVTARHAAALREAASLIDSGRDGAERELAAELIAADLRGALASMRAITGEDYTQATLGRIFAGFCIGK